MHNQTTQQSPHGTSNTRRGLKSLAAVGAMLLIALSIYASQTALQPAKDERFVNLEQDDKTPAHTAKAVAAAQKFLQGLDEKLRAKATFDFNSDQRPKWSNLPVTFVPRNGTRMGELSKEQRDAGMELVASVTSKGGYQKILDIIAGDDYLAAKGGGKGKDKDKGKGDKDKGKGGKGGPNFGFDNFYLAVFGKPSPTEPWLVQFGGHHLAVNITVVGKDFVLTPTLTCAQPSSFAKGDKTIRPLGSEHDLAFKLMASLDEKQKAKAILKNRVSDLILGPGKDGKDLAADGIKGAELDEKQQALLLELAGAWVQILHESSADKRMAEIKANVKDTYFAWSGPAAEGSVAYFRVQGPSVVIEYAPQGNTDHIHTIVRELGNDYGKKLIK